MRIWGRRTAWDLNILIARTNIEDLTREVHSFWHAIALAPYGLAGICVGHVCQRSILLMLMKTVACVVHMIVRGR